MFDIGEDKIIISANDIKFSLDGINYALLREFSVLENEKYKKAAEVYSDLFNKDIFLINNNAIYFKVEKSKIDLTSFFYILNGIGKAIEWEELIEQIL